MIASAELIREMGCTRAEFERWLPGATRHAPVESAGNTYRIHIGAGIVEISVTERAPRRIANIVLPILSVCFRFMDIGNEDREAFLDFFDRYTRRGGG
jgi:hypothetical protein